MNKSIVYSSDLANKDYIGFFDRIINIKFTRRDNTFFTLRSDYEPVWHNNVLYFKTCQPKPEIKIEYKQLKGKVLNVDIFVTNLNIKDYDDNQNEVEGDVSPRQGITTDLPNDALSSKGNPVIKAEIEMGYRGDFYNWSQYMSNGFKGKTKEVYDAFLNLESLEDKSIGLLESQLAFGKHRRCVVKILYAANISNPPDRVTQFHGIIGDTYAGFQPFATLAMDYSNVDGLIGVLTKKDIFNSLDDLYDKIDEMPTEQYVKKSAKSVVSTNKRFRNFFNGGHGFTLLEALCFHTITRRFLRSNIPSSRNINLELAYFEHFKKTIFNNNASDSFEKYKLKIEQNIYSQQKEFYPEFFKEQNGLLIIAPNTPPESQEFLETLVATSLSKHFIGPRFTIKNLPVFRQLYSDIREKIKEASKKDEFLPWWSAAEQLEAKKITPNLTDTAIKVEDEVKAMTDYVIKMMNGEIKTDAKIEHIVFSPDWIIPLENLKSIIPLKDNTNTKIEVEAPVSANEETTTKIYLPCFTSLLEVRDAYMFGTAVLCSKKASEKVEEKFKNDDIIEFPVFATAQSQISWFCSEFGLLVEKMNNGFFILRDEAEDSLELSRQDFILHQTQRPVRIPAIYDVVVTPVLKMRLPFIGFLDPLTPLEWQSTSSIGNVVTFYTQKEKGRNLFLTLMSDISFSTTGKENEMELTLLPAQVADPSKLPSALTAKDRKEEDKYKYTQVIINIADDEQMDSWRKIYESDMTNIPLDLLSLFDVGTIDPKKQICIGKTDFFLRMKEWNPTLFALSTEPSGGWSVSDGYKRIDWQADWLYGENRPDKKVHFPDLELCFALPELDTKLKRIYLKFPILPVSGDYGILKEAEPENILFYNNGTWYMTKKTELSKIFTIEGV